MSKIARKSWKGSEATKDSPSPAPTVHDIEHMSSSSRDTPIQDTIGAPSVSDASLGDLSVSSKRTRDDFEKALSNPSIYERPAKFLRISNSDSLRNRLPEIVGAREREEGGLALSHLSLKERILEQSKQENSKENPSILDKDIFTDILIQAIAILPPAKPSITLLVDVVAWSIEQERERLKRLPESKRLRSRTVLIVADDMSSMDKYASTLENAISDITVGRYSEESHSPELQTWTELLRKDVVMTSSHLLLHSLLRGALAVTQLNVLIISEAQNIRNQDSHPSMPIVQVMNDFYRITDSWSRPRVFAIVSAPDRHTQFDSKMLKLEQALDSKVFGVSEDKRLEILALPDRPSELVILYDGSRKSTETRLLKQLHQLDPNESIFRRHYRNSRFAHEDIGPCASDLVWRRSLKELEAELILNYDDVDVDDNEYSLEDRLKIQVYRIVKNWAYTMPNMDVSSRGFNVSHKFLRLVQLLNKFKSYGEGFRGIIFGKYLFLVSVNHLFISTTVQRRAIALVLSDLLRTLGDRFLRPQSIIGSNNDLTEAYHVEYKFLSVPLVVLTMMQQDIFHDFATGVCNLLIATKSIEDLDVPKASVVIRYDLFESQVSHAYVRARTRGRESHLVHMVERGNDVHRRILHRITNIDADMLKWTEILCNSAESSIPPESLQETINSYHSDSDDEDAGPHSQFIEDPTTGGRIYVQDATTAIYRYASGVRRIIPNTPLNHALFTFKDIQKEFGIPRAYVCAINLPSTPIDKTFGDTSVSKADARRSACFKACKLLYASGLLDCRLVPLPNRLRAQYDFESRRVIGKDSLPEVKPISGTRPYRRKQPVFWENCSDALSDTLYPTIVSVNGSDNDSEVYAPIVILTKKPLPVMPSFRLFCSGSIVDVHFQKALPLMFDEERLNNTHLFTVRICRAIMNKALVCPLEDMPYFFLPLPLGWRPIVNNPLEIPDIANAIPWELVAEAAHHWAVPIKRASPEELEADLYDAVVQDRWIEFTRRYKVVQVRKDLTPLSKPSDSRREMSYESLFHFCKSKRKGLETLSDFNQAIIEVSKVPAILNNLNPISKAPVSTAKSPAKYLIPELCAKFTLPASTLWTSMLLPSIMRRINDILLVKELDAKYFDHAIREDLLHNAICAPSAGLEYDYERLELLGDAFLKYLSTVYVFVANPSLNEGALHVARQKIISNKSLLVHSTRVGLPEYILSKVFAYKTWHPPHFRVFTPPKAPKVTVGSDTNVSQADNQVGPEDITEDAGMDEGAADIAVGDEMAGVDDMADFVEDVEDAVPSIEKDRVENGDDSVDEDKPSSPPLPNNAPLDEMITEPVVQNGSRTATPPTNVQPLAEPRATKKKGKSKKKKAGNDDSCIQYLGDKAIADVAEAIIGAAYISGGREVALQATKALTIPLSNIDRWSDFGRKVLTPPPNVIAKLPPSSIAAIEQIIGHKFNRPHLLAQAMTHSSIQGYESTSYERLEFIGDAILDFMVIRHIFDRDQQLAPGALTMLKGAMVSNSALAAVCVWSGLQNHLLFESPILATSIQTYINELKDRQEKEYALAEQEGRNPGQYWLDIEPPKALSDVVESIVGAIYISDNFSPVGAETLFDNVLKPFYDKHITLHTLSHHPTKILFELCQAQGCQQFEITREKVGNMFCCEVVVHDVVLSSAEDITPFSAGRQASLLALDALEGDADFMTRVCDCRVHTHKKTGKKKDAFEEALARALAAQEEEDEITGDAEEQEDRPLEEC
ncbi:Dicer-like protein 1 [Psilocybe cubensis]|uniref:Dicer-like protein 1 n=2 Tax=Psilocybe cubensis TaxID=181762 RepID=A0ACB8H571_PSICU|nr:Dicer-like protein 1 [Psilocybe cubensis]KAH9482923.1 Dicer-like protein 1 [Psilocybe cubensis]